MGYGLQTGPDGKLAVLPGGLKTAATGDPCDCETTACGCSCPDGANVCTFAYTIDSIANASGWTFTGVNSSGTITIDGTNCPGPYVLPGAQISNGSVVQEVLIGFEAGTNRTYLKAGPFISGGPFSDATYLFSTGPGGFNAGSTTLLCHTTTTWTNGITSPGGDLIGYGGTLTLTGRPS